MTSKLPPFLAQVINGVSLPQFLPPEKVKECMDFIPSLGDVILATYPKSGTTWCSQIITLLKNKGIPPQNGDEYLYSCPYLELTGTEILNTMSEPRCYKTHLDYAHSPRSSEAKYIYVVRNPKDYLISFFHFSKSSLLGGSGGQIDVIFNRFVKGETWYNDYFDHVLSWYEHRHDSNVIFLYYEKMKDDIETVVKDIGNFLGGRMKESAEDPKILKDVLHFSSFNYMKETTNAQSRAVMDKVEKDTAKSRNRVEATNEGTASGLDNAPIVRKGIVGDWKNVLTPEQNQIFDELIERRLKGTEMYDYWKSIGCI